MKISWIIVVFLISTAIGTQAQVVGGNLKNNVRRPALPAITDYSVVARDANSQTWERTLYEYSPSGQPIPKKHRVTELNTGLNYWDGRQWNYSDPSFQVSPDGSLATAERTQHKVQLAANLNTLGSVKITTPDGTVLDTTPVAIALNDAASGNSLVIGAITNCTGVLVSSNKVVYKNAFSDISADIVYTMNRGSFHQDVILKQNIDPTAYGFPADSTRIQIITEFYDHSTPEEITRPLKVEKNRAARSRMVSPDLIDHTLIFGQLKFGRGVAYTAASTNRAGGAQVGKEFKTVAGRRFLIESVEYNSLKKDLRPLAMGGQGTPTKTFPMSNQNGNSDFRTISKIKGRKIKLNYATVPSPPLKSTGAFIVNKVQSELARTETRSGVVIDYVVTTGTQGEPMVFQGDTTYFISGQVYCNDVIVEGGTVVKYPNDYASSIEVDGSLTCDTSPYRPAIFTAADDDAVGESMGGIWDGYTGVIAPRGYANPTFYSPYNSLNFSNVRISHSVQAASVGDYCSVIAIDSQFLDCLQLAMLGSDWWNSGVSVSCNNCLLSEIPTLVADYAEGQNYYNFNNCTIDQCTQLMTYSNPIGYFSAINSIFANVADGNISNYPSLFSGGNNGFYNVGGTFGAAQYISGTSPFQVVGAGDYYLTGSSSFHQAGTTGIDPGLLADIATKTTRPPLVYSNITFLVATNFGPRVQRDTNSAPDLGYHYDPLDYAFGGVNVNSNVTFAAGTAVGWFQLPDSGGSGFGISLNNNVTATFTGTATQPCVFARYDTVQEGGNGLWTDKGWLAGLEDGGSYDPSNPSRVTASFTHFYRLIGDPNHIRDGQYGQPIVIQAKNCEFYGAFGGYNIVGIYTNCLFYRGGTGVDTDSSYVQQVLVNCTFYGGFLNFHHRETTSPFWYSTVQNCAFDQNTSFDINHPFGTNVNIANYNFNAFLEGMLELPTEGSNTITVADFNWQNSWFGNFYLPPNSLLTNAGSTTADQLSLYQFTTQASQVKETNSAVDIGYHYVAANQYGNPFDSNGNGLPDYLEDTNGNGLGAWMPPPVITTQPASQLVFVGNNTTLQVTVTSLVPASYQWYFNGTNLLAGATNSTLNFQNVQITDAGHYSVTIANPAGGVTSSVATLIVAFPVSIITQPSSQTVVSGSTVSFAVSASGTGPLSYQWLKNGAPLSSSSTNLTLTNVQDADAALYQVIISNLYQTVYSQVATLTVLDPPTIITQPTNLTAGVGQTAIFGVVAVGTAPLAYQWYLNSIAIANQTNDTLTLNSIQTNNAGNYSVVITNMAGSVVSSGATLTVIVPATITVPPMNIIAATGSNATFTVTASGTPPLSYQWYFNGVPLANGNNGIDVACDIIWSVVSNNLSQPLNTPTSVDVDGSGNIYIADTANNLIRKVGTNGAIVTVAGVGGFGGYSGDNGAATSAKLNSPRGVALDGFGNLYIADSANNAVRKVDTNGTITTVVSSNTLSLPVGLDVDGSGNLYIADFGHHIVRKLANGIVTTVAGNGTSDYYGINIPATNAEFFNPAAVTVDTAGNLYIADYNVSRGYHGLIRKVDTNGIVTTVAGCYQANVNLGNDGLGDGGLATNASLTLHNVSGNPATGLAMDNVGNLYIADSGNGVIRMVATNGIITIAVGTPFSVSGYGYSGDGGPATSARMNAPQGVAVGGPVGNLYIADTMNNAIREVTGPTASMDTNGTLTIFNAQTCMNGNYQVIVSNSAGTGTSPIAGLTVYPATATPVITPNGGAFRTQQMVTLNCSTPGAVMHYTLNGNIPTMADPAATNGQVVVLFGSSTLNVDAFATGFAPSAVSSAVFNITGAVSAGDKFTLALAYNGGVWAAGTNSVSQLGDGTTSSRVGWVAVSNLTSGVMAISAGTNFGLALLTNGMVKAWGFNASGQLGDTTTTTRATNVLVTNLTSVVAIAAGGSHSLALLTNGTVRAWGNNANGQLGNGNLSITSSKTNLTVLVLSNATAIAAGGMHSLALSNGYVVAWGYNSSGQLGDGTTTQRATNVLVTNLSSVVAIAAGGSHSLALLTNGTVRSWGLNNGGQLGDGTVANRTTNVLVTNLTTVVAIAAGTSHSLALLSNGQVMAWGTNNFGQLGDGTTNQYRLTPILVTNLSNVVAIAAGSQHSVALESNGVVVIWGCTNYGMGGYTSVPMIQQPTNRFTYFVAPSIVTQPSSVSTSVGQNVALEVSVIGTMPMNYQWYSNSIALAAATNAVLIFNNPQPNVSANYYVITTNAVGSVTSAVATLAVLFPPVINSQPPSLTLSAGSTAIFTVAVSGSLPLTYQWYGVHSGLLTGATGSSLVLNNIQPANNDNYFVVLSNSIGSVTSAYAPLSVVAPVITSQPSSQVVTAGNSAGFSVAAGGLATYQWYFNLEPIAGATNSTLLLTNVSLSAMGNYFVMVSNTVGITVSANASLTVNPAMPVTPPANLINWWPAENTALDVVGGQNGTLSSSGVSYGAGEVGQAFHFSGANSSVSFGTTAGGFGTNDFSIEFWMRSAGTGTFSEYPIIAKTAACNSFNGFTIRLEGQGNGNQYPGTLVADLGQSSGNYIRLQSSRVVNDGLFHHVALVRQSMNLALYLDGTYETSGSSTGVVSVGMSAILTAGVSPCVGTDGGLATNYFGDLDELSLYNRGLQASEIQSIYNAAGAGKISSAPYFITQPTNQLLFVGNNATFSVSAGGSSPLSYQWYGCQAGLLTGATTANLNLANLQITTADSYFVVVTNSFGSATSVAAALTVLNSSNLSTWETANFGTTNVNLNADADGDGWSNLQEYLNGTNPNGADQPLNIIITQPRANSIVP